MNFISRLCRQTLMAILLLLPCMTGHAAEYAYDALHRLVSAVYEDSGQSIHYSYDAAGNILSVRAASPEYAISGHVRDASGNSIADVLVQAGERTALSDAAGHYEITGLPEGEYSVAATKDGYEFPSASFTVNSDNPAPEINIAEKPPAEPLCRIYAVSGRNQIITVSQDTMAAEALGPPHSGVNIQGMDFHPQTRQLFAVSEGDSGSELLPVNPQTGGLSSAVIIRDASGNAFHGVAALGFLGDGSLWGFARAGDAERRGLLKINPRTAIAALEQQSSLNVEGMGGHYYYTDRMGLAAGKALYAYTPGGAVTHTQTFPDLPGAIQGLIYISSTVAAYHRDGKLNVYTLDTANMDRGEILVRDRYDS
ncbi:MAG: hypothetical protein GY862_04580, partial [Gammaproteobacteria bacterium]|nr:hypothetical protein [Gammaproteobacteria bacterium]